MSKFLDSNGLSYFWGKLKAYFVAKEVGKGLSTNDFTTAEKNKLAGIEAGAEVNTVTSVNGQTGAVTVPSVVMSDTAPLMDGTASAGVSDEAARGDHVHPHDLSLLPLDTVTGNPVVIDAYPAPAEGLIIALTPHQSGSGTPSPSNIRPISGYSDVELARYRKNLLNPLVAYNSIGYNVAVGNTIVPTAAAKQWQDNGDGTFTISSLGSWAQAGLISTRLPLGKAYLKISNIKGGLRVSVYVCNKDLKINRTSLLRNPASEGETIYVDTTFVNDDAYFVVYLSGSGANASITEPYAYSGSTAATDPYEPYVSPTTVNVHVGGLGKNKLPNTAQTSTIQGVTYTVNSDGTITASGKSTGWTGLTVSTFTLPAGTYKIYSLVGNQTYNYYLELSANGSNIASTSSTSMGVSFSLAESTTITCKLLARPNVDLLNLVCYPMILLASETATAYEPYFVIGGEYDVLVGELKVTYGYIASYNGESLPSKWISDRDVYAAGTTPTTGAEVAYELATPTVYAFTPQPFDMLDGTNTFITNTDSLTISYRCYIQKYIQKLIAALA